MDVDDNVDLDIYGDLPDFDLAEKLREAHESVADLTARLNASIETITRMEATNKEITRDKNSLSKNLSSLLFTAKNEIHRKDREIESLRREKEDICFRRNQAVSKNQRPTPSIAICKSMKVQTELSFSGDDCIEVQRTGQFHVAVSVKSSQKGDLDRDRQISNDKRRDVSRTQSHSDRDGPRYNEQRNPFAFHHLDKVDRRRKSVVCRSSRSDSGKGRTGGVETDKVRKYESKDRATKRHLDSSDNDERYPKRPKQNSPDRYKRRDDRRCTENDGRPTKTRSDMNRGSASRSHSDSSDRANEVKGSLSMPRNEPTVEIRDPLSRQDVRCEKPIKINVKQINANVAISRDIDSTKELIRESKLQPIVGIEKIISVNIPQLKDCVIPTHKTDIVEATPKVNQKEQTLIDLPANTTITSSRLRDSTKSDSHSPDSTTLNEDPKTSSLDGNANSPAVELFTCSKPVDTSMQLPSQLQSNLQPLPSVFELFKPPVDKPQLQSRPHADKDISTTKATNSDNTIHTNTVPITSDTAMTTKTAKSQNQNILGSSEIFKDIQTSVNTSTISCRPITTAKEITLGTKSDVSACSTVTCGQSKLTDNTSTKSCKPITSRRKTVAVEATSKAKDINLQAKQDTTIINKPATLLTEASSNITCGQSHNKNQLSETSNDVSKKSCKPITLRRKTMAAEPKCNPRLAKEINATSTVKNQSEGITFSSDEIPNKTCKPITSRRKTLAAEPTTNRITKLNRAKPSETPTIDSTSSVGVKKSVCETSKTNRNVYKPNTNKVLAKEEIVTKPEDNQSKTAKPKTRIKSETKKGNGSKEADKNPKSNVAKQKSPLNVLFDELNEFTDLRSKLRSQKDPIKETRNTTKHTESVKSEDESNRNAKFQKPIVEKTSLDRKDVRDRQESQDKPSEDFPATKLDKENPQKDNSIEQKLANLFGSETSGSEHCSPINIPESDLRSCLENAFRASDVTAVNSTNSPEPINICDTPIASLVEQIFSTNDEGCNDPNVSDASSTSLRVVRESVEQIDLYLTRRKRQSNGKHRFRQCLAVAELNSSTESKTIDLSDNHNSVSMDVDIELTQKCIHDAQAQTSSIISLFDALQTPRKSDPKFELVEDTGSLFGKSVATPKIPNNVDQCSLSFAPNVNGNANIPNEDNRITKPTQLSTIAHALDTLTDTSSELNVPGVQSITANTENLANQSSCHVDGKFLADHSFVPSHQAPSTMDQSFLNMIPIKNHHVDRVIANHYEEYLSDVKINDLSTLSDLFGAEDLPSRTQAMFGDKQQSANTDNIEKLPSMSSDLKEITTSPSKPIKSLSKETDQTNPTPTPDVLPETSADPIPQIPTTELQPIPAALVTTQTPLQTSITEEIAANTSSTSNSTPSHTKTARLSYYVEEDTTNNEVTMFITRKKKRKTKK